MGKSKPLDPAQNPHLPKLHEHIDDAEEAARGKRRSGVPSSHVVFVKGPLALGEAAADDMLMLLRQLFLDFALQTSQQERAQHTVQAVNQLLQTGPIKVPESGPESGPESEANTEIYS